MISTVLLEIHAILKVFIYCRYIEAISKVSFGTNPVLDSRFKSSKYYSIHPKGISCGHLLVETRARLDFDPKSYF